MPDGKEKKRVASGKPVMPGLKPASQSIQDMPASSTLVGGKEYPYLIYQKDSKYKPVSTSSDTISNIMDEGGPEQYLRGSYESRKPAAKKKVAAAPKKRNDVIDEIASKYRSGSK